MEGKKRKREENWRLRKLLDQLMPHAPGFVLSRNSNHCLTLPSAQASWLSHHWASPTGAHGSAQAALSPTSCQVSSPGPITPVLPHTCCCHQPMPLVPVSQSTPPSDWEPFLTHRWESANQPHPVLALVQMLNWEEEQFHTPYLA